MAAARRLLLRRTRGQWCATVPRSPVAMVTTAGASITTAHRGGGRRGVFWSGDVELRDVQRAAAPRARTQHERERESDDPSSERALGVALFRPRPRSRAHNCLTLRARLGSFPRKRHHQVLHYSRGCCNLFSKIVTQNF